MSAEYTTWAWRQAIPPVEKLLLLKLADEAGAYGPHRTSVDDIRAALGLTADEAQAAIRRLDELGYLNVRVDGGTDGMWTVGLNYGVERPNWGAS